MGLFSNFFGEAKSKSKIVQTPNWNAEQQAIFGDLAGQISSTGVGPAPTAPQMYADQTEQDKTYFDYAKSEAVKNMATGVVPYEVGSDFGAKYFESALRPTYEYDWKNTTLPGIQEQYAGSTFNSTGRDDAVSKATSEFGLRMGKEKADLMYKDELAKREAIDKAYARVAQGQTLAGQAATYSRAIETEKVMDSVQRYLMGEEVDGEYNPAYNPMVTLAFNLLGLQPFSTNVQTKTTGEGLGYGMVKGFVDFNSGAMVKDLLGGGQATSPTGTSSNVSTQGNQYSAGTGDTDPYSGYGGSVATGASLFGNYATETPWWAYL